MTSNTHPFVRLATRHLVSAGHMLLAVVVQTPKGTLFFQRFGPAAAVEQQRAAYLACAKGLSP